MKYAIISTNGKQYRVSAGDVIEVEHLKLQPNDEYIFPNTLLLVDGDKRTIGTPFLSDIPVKGKVVMHAKKEKIRVSKFKAKARYRRVTGHRAIVTRVKIEEFGEKYADLKK